MAALALNACSSSRGNIAVGDAVCMKPVPPRRTPLPLAIPAQNAGFLTADIAPELVHGAVVIGAAGALPASPDTPTGRNGALVFNVSASNPVSFSIGRASLGVPGAVAALNGQDARIAKLAADLNQREAILSNRLALTGNAVSTG